MHDCARVNQKHDQDEYKNALTEDRKILYPSDFADPSEPMKKRGTPMYGRSTEDKEKFENINMKLRRMGEKK